MTIRCCSIAFGAIAGLLASASVLAGELSAVDKARLAIVKGGELGALAGEPFSDYSLMAMRDGKLEPIPYQFDDMNDAGFPYVEGGNFQVLGTAGQVDADDELVFMLKDGGDKADLGALSAAEGTAVAEIAAQGQSGTRYAYLFKGNAARSETTYANIDLETGMVTTENWTLQMDPDNPLIWSDMTYKGFRGGKSVLDTMKLRAKARLGFIGATVGNNLIPADLVAVKNGPVRSIGEADASIGILGINLLSAGADFIASANSMNAVALASIPGAASVLSSLAIEISLDFNELEGMKTWSALGPSDPVVAGQTADGAGKLAVDKDTNWLAASHPGGFDVTAAAVFPPELELTVSPLYKDATQGDEEDTPERFPGSHPQVGYVLTDIPTGIEVALGIQLFFGNGLLSGGHPGEVVDSLYQPVGIQVQPL